MKVVSNEFLKDLPAKWDLADSLPDNKPANFIHDTLLRGESKAISVDRLTSTSARFGITFEKFNEIVFEVDNRLRTELEKKHGSKYWEIDREILTEATKSISLPVKPFPMIPSIGLSKEEIVQKTHEKTNEIQR